MSTAQFQASPVPAASPDVSIEALHQPDHAAHVQVPQAPLGQVSTNATAGASLPGQGAKALLAKKMALGNPSYVSPTDNLMTPVSAKLNQSRKKNFGRAKGVQLFASKGPMVLEPTTAEVDENKMEE